MGSWSDCSRGSRQTELWFFIRFFSSDILVPTNTPKPLETSPEGSDAAFTCFLAALAENQTGHMTGNSRAAQS